MSDRVLRSIEFGQQKRSKRERERGAPVSFYNDVTDVRGDSVFDTPT